MRDDFSTKTKNILAGRVGYLCSNPNCRKPTYGPNDIPDKIVNIGVAAHITAASEGGPRYNSNLNSNQRKSLENGIWLCQNCGKLIDSNPEKYSIIVINKWKIKAEIFAENQLTTQTKIINRKENEEEEFRKAIELEKQLLKELTIENYHQKFELEELVKRPHIKFKRSRFILRSFEDTTYPDCTGFGWCRTFMYDFYDRGILIWIDALFSRTAIMNKQTKEWYVEEIKLDKRPINDNEIRLHIRTLGKLPYTNIIHWKDGDDIYNDYHLYCKYYGVNDSPYEGIEYRYSHDEDGFFWNEINQTKKIENGKKK